MSRYFAPANSITQMQVTGEIPADRLTWLSEKLTANAFQSIEETLDEASMGWVQTENIDDSTFESPIAYARDHYALFTLRSDQRRVATPILRTHVIREEKKYLSENPNLRRVPKAVKEEINERVKLKLLAKTQPMPTFIDIAWDLDSGVVSVFSASTAAIDKFETVFRKSFEGLHLTLIHPLARAKGVVVRNYGLLEALVAADQSGSDDVTAQIKGNSWIGHDFLLWLLHRGIEITQDHTVNLPGHNKSGIKFGAWIDEKIEMAGSGGGGEAQRVMVNGSQDCYREVKSALTMGKQVTSATIYLEMAENQWKITLDSLFFTFKSFRSPGIQVEKDTPVDEMSAIEAVFFEKIYLIESGLQCFDSLLLEFLIVRLGTTWNDTLADIQAWAETIGETENRSAAVLADGDDWGDAGDEKDYIPDQ